MVEKTTQNHPNIILVLGYLLDEKGILGDCAKSRVKIACNLWKKNHQSHILFSGYCGLVGNKKPIITEALAMKNYALFLGVPENKIILEEKSRDTIGNAYFSKEIIVKKKWKNIFVVTSDFHIERAKFTFKKIFDQSFNIEYFGAKSKPSIKNTLSEKILMQIYKNFFVNIKEGDDKSIRELMLHKHPAYGR